MSSPVKHIHDGLKEIFYFILYFNDIIDSLSVNFIDSMSVNFIDSKSVNFIDSKSGNSLIRCM